MQTITLSPKIAEYSASNWHDMGYEVVNRDHVSRTVALKNPTRWCHYIALYAADNVQPRSGPMKAKNAEYARSRQMGWVKILKAYVAGQATAYALFGERQDADYVENYVAFPFCQETIFCFGNIVAQFEDDEIKQALQDAYMATWLNTRTESAKNEPVLYQGLPLYNDDDCPKHLKVEWAWRNVGFSPVTTEPRGYLKTRKSADPMPLFTMFDCEAPDYSDFPARREGYIQRIKQGGL